MLFIESIMSVPNSESSTSSLTIWMPHFLFCLIAVARISNTMWSNSGVRGHPCLVPDLRGKAFSFSPLRMILAVGFSYMAFVMLRYVPSILTLLRVFVMNGCDILSNAFPASVESIVLFFSFLLLLWCIMLIDL